MRHLLRRLRYLVHHRRIDRELADEIEAHREMRQRELEAGGLSPSEARATSVRAMGNMMLAQEEARDVWIVAAVRELAQDLRFAARLLVRDRGFTVVASLALALGIGVNNTQFAIVNAYCLRGLPIAHADRVLYLSMREADGGEHGLSSAQFEAVRDAAASFTGMAAYTSAPVSIAETGGAADRVQAAYVSGDWLRLLGREPAIGRTIEPADDRSGAAPVVILGGDVWRSRYGSDPGVVGRVVRIAGTLTTVIGVMPDEFTFPNHAEIWLPLAAMPEARPGEPAAALDVFGRLRPGASTSDASAEVDALTATLPGLHATERMRLELRPINERYNGRITDPAWIAFTIVGGLLVMIACANVANLLLMRSLARSREIAVRAAIGASRWRIVRQLLAESALLAALGGLLGLGLSAIGLRSLLLLIPKTAVPYGGFVFDGRVLLVLAVVCLGTVFLFGLAPALQVSRTDVNGVLKSSARTGTQSPHARRWTMLFLTAEFALTVMLLANLALTVQAFRDSQRADRVLDTSRLLTAWVDLPADTYPTADRRMSFYASLRERVGVDPGVAASTVAAGLPLGPAARSAVTIEGRTPAGQAARVITLVVGTGYFQTLGQQLLRGRDFVDADGTPGHDSAVVTRRFADLYFPGETAVGRRIALAHGSAAPPERWTTIVGVAQDPRGPGPLQPPPVLYIPFRASAPAVAALILRANAEPTTLASVVRDAVHAIDPDVPTYRIMTMDRARDEARWNGRVSGDIITAIACIALLLASVGLYAVTSHAVVQRTAEIGIRVALGAPRGRIVWMVVRRAFVHVAIGLAFGIPLTIGWERLFAAPGTLTAGPVLMQVAGVLALVALVAAAAPARRAVRLDPLTALRQE